LVDEGRYLSMSEVARAEGVTPAAVSKALGRWRREVEGGGEREVAAK
jgi:transposase-like protein